MRIQKNKYQYIRHHTMMFLEHIRKYGRTLGTSLLMLILVCSCSNDTAIPDSVNPTDALTIQFNIPQAEHIITRGDQGGGEIVVNSITLLVYDNEGNNILQREDLNIEKDAKSTEFSHTIMLKGEAKSATNPQIYAIAHATTKEKNIDLLDGFIIGSNKTVNDLLKVTSTRHYGIDNGFLMSGKAEISNGSPSINLIRTCAKITLKDESKNDSFELITYKPYGTASNCYIAAALREEKSQCFPDNKRDVELISVIQQKVGDTYRYDCYVHPTYPNTSNPNQISPLVVIEAKYNGDTYYYGVPIRNNSDGTYYELKPNHWYEMRITSVKGPGYPSPEEALSNPILDNIEVDIHDHSPNIYNMISNGYQELGVSDDISIKNSDTGNLYAEFFIRLACEENTNCSHIPSLDSQQFQGSVYKHEVANCNYTVEIIDGTDWLSLNRIDLVTDNNSIGSDQASNGKTFKYQLNVNAISTVGGELEGLIRVSWQGLTRVIKVSYSTEYDPRNVCTVSLTISDKDTNTESTIKNYWRYIVGKGSLESRVSDTQGSADPKLFGNKSVDMGESRAEGIHLPMPYGDNLWEYEYKINFRPLYKSGQVLEKITWDITGDKFLKNSVFINWDEYDHTVSLKLNEEAKTSYVYEVGNVVFEIKYENLDPIEVNLSLYHTGFFHFEDIAKDKGYYYYEVVEMENGEHWLDRNLRAKSNGLYIQDENGGGVFSGSEGYPFSSGEACGDYVTVAANSHYDDPALINNVCPPGYRIPTQTEFDRLRNSNNFHTEVRKTSFVTYYTSLYETSDGREIYFPKGRFKNNDDLVGDNRAGYYWTQTPSYGLEKDEIGNWLTAFYINGNSTSFVNANVTSHKLLLRCIAGTGKVTETKYTVGFKVKGATHVYLYTIDNDGNKSGLFSFPGKAVGSQAAVDGLDYSKVNAGTGYSSDNSYLHFSYRSTIPAEKLYVFFAYVTDNNKITIISENGNQTLAGATGWEVKVGGSYFFYPTEEDHSKVSEKRIFP